MWFCIFAEYVDHMPLPLVCFLVPCLGVCASTFLASTCGCYDPYGVCPTGLFVLYAYLVTGVVVAVHKWHPRLIMYGISDSCQIV